MYGHQMLGIARSSTWSGSAVLGNAPNYSTTVLKVPKPGNFHNAHIQLRLNNYTKKNFSSVAAVSYWQGRMWWQPWHRARLAVPQSNHILHIVDTGCGAENEEMGDYGSLCHIQRSSATITSFHHLLCHHWRTSKAECYEASDVKSIVLVDTV